MSDEVKTCTKCGHKLRAHNLTGICGGGTGPAAKKCRARLAGQGDDESDVLDRMGFGALAKKPEADEAPPATAKKPRAPRKPKLAEPPPIDWPAQLVALAAALGLDGKQIIEDFARGWVEHTALESAGTRAQAAAGGER